MSEEKVCTGVCVWFSGGGIGFIANDDGSGDLFVHWSNIEMEGFKALKAGAVVSFEIGENHKGPQAVNVKILRDPEPDFQDQGR